MNSLSGRFRLLAAAMCGITLALTACNAVEDVREAPSTPVPIEKEVIKGTITGLGYRRPLVLEDTGVMRCTDPTNPTGPKIYCRQSFFGNFDEAVSHFSFGSLELGAPYNITIRNQPYGKICSFTSAASGTVVADVDIDIQVNCVTDTTIARYCIAGTIPQPIHDLPGLRITLSTEEGLRVLSDDPTVGADGPLPPAAQSCWFPDSIFNSASSLPILRWYVTAAYQDSTGKLNNCRVTGGGANTGSNDLGENTITSSADVTNVSIAACDFSIGGNVGYSQPAPTSNYTPQTISGLTIKLKAMSGDWATDSTGTEVAAYTIPAVTPPAPNGTATTPFTIGGTATPTRFLSNETSLYDVQITNQPTGQFCMVAATGVVVPITAGGTSYPAGAALTIGAGAQLANVNRPLTNGFINSLVYSWTTYTNLTNLAVRCRALPGTAANPSAVLTGTYQMTTIASAVNAGTTTNTTTLTRNFLTFFDDGSFIHGNRVTASGVERGFYNYNTATGTIAFTVLTDTNNNYPVNAVPLTATQVGISALPSLTLTSVVKVAGTRSRITAFAGTVTSGATTTSTTWQLDEPSAVAGTMEGTWTTGILPGGTSPDHRRVFVYNASTTFGTHVSTIGPAVNFGDACYFLYQLNNVPNPQALEGYYARRGTSANGTGNSTGGSETSTGCPIGSTTPTTVAATLDYYAPLPIQRLLLAYPWRLPGSNSGFDGRSPSPNFFSIVPGSGATPDQITITGSDQGVLQPATTVTFERTKAN